MKRIMYVARNEVRSLFYSPIAWILMILFLILTSADYFGLMEMFTGMFERGGPSLMMTNDLTDNLLSNPMFGYLFGVVRNLYIFFPLITMGLISREVSSGTIKLLYSSPINVIEVVLGKFTAMIVFTLSLICMMLFTFMALSHSLTHPDYGHMLASAIGLFLLLCTYAAIGLFISSLTSYQIVAALVTLAVFAFLSKVGGLWQDVDILRGITFYMNIGGKSRDLIIGLFNSRDIFYFLILISSFLAFTVIKVRSATQSVSKLKKTTRYLVVILVAFIIGFITNKPQLNAYLDTTRDQVHTITPPTQAMVAKLNEAPLEITVYSNLLDFNFGRFLPQEQNNIISFLFEPYIRFKPNIHVKFVYYYNTDTASYYYKINKGKTIEEIAEKEAKTYGLNIKRFLSPEEVNKLVDTKQEEFRQFFELKYKDRKAILRTFDDNDYWPSENEIAASINRLIATPPKITFLGGQIERGPYSERVRDYKMIASQLGNRHALINQGYDFDTLSIDQSSVIPTNIAALVIADPRSAFSQSSLDKINSYIAKGGNLFIASEPDRRDVIKPLFDTLGLSLRNGLLIQPSEQYSSDQAFAYISDTAQNFSPQFHKFFQDELKYYGDSLFRVALGGGSVMEYQEKNGFHITPLLTTDKSVSWNRLAPISTDSLQLKVGRLPSDEQGNFTTAVLLRRSINGKDQRIIAASDADYLTKAVIYGGYSPKRYNYDFGFWCFSYFSYGQFPANTLRPQTDDSMDIKVADLSTQKAFLYYIIPALIALLGSIILIRRKRK